MRHSVSRACHFGVRKIFPACRKPLANREQSSIVSQFFFPLLSFHFLRDFSSRSIFLFSSSFFPISRACFCKFLPSYIFCPRFYHPPIFNQPLSLLWIPSLVTCSIKKKIEQEATSFSNVAIQRCKTRVKKMTFHCTNTF